MDCAIPNLRRRPRVAKLITRSAAGRNTRSRSTTGASTIDPGGRKIVIAPRGAPDDSSLGVPVQRRRRDRRGVGVQALGRQADPAHQHGGDSHLFGTNLTLEDFARTARVVFPGRCGARRRDGRRPPRLRRRRPSRLPDAGSEYSRIVTSIEKEHVSPCAARASTRTFEKGERPRKIYTVEPANDVQVDGKYANAARAQLDDARTARPRGWRWTSSTFPAKVDAAFFTPEALARAGR